MTTNNPEFLAKAVFRRGHQVKVCIQHVFDRAQTPALNVDMDNGANSDWSTKKTFQLTIDECSLVVAYFLNLVNEVYLGFHGANNNNSLHLAPSKQEAGAPKQHYLAIYQGGETQYYIHLTHHESFRFFNLALDQLVLHYQHPKMEVITLIKEFYR